MNGIPGVLIVLFVLLPLFSLSPISLHADDASIPLAAETDSESIKRDAELKFPMWKVGDKVQLTVRNRAIEGVLTQKSAWNWPGDTPAWRKPDNPRHLSQWPVMSPPHAKAFSSLVIPPSRQTTKSGFMRIRERATIEWERLEI